MKINDFKNFKTATKQSTIQKICILTCYDYPSARIIADSNVDCVLVGDSLAMVVHGHESTITATMDMMVLHTQAVARGIKNQLIISDLPFLSYRASLADTVCCVQKLMHAGAEAIKLEGGDDDICHTVKHLTQSGIPIMGHLGLTPQSICQLGAYKVQGKEQEQAARILHQALALEAAGCFAIVLECVPSALAAEITKALNIPTIGIGASNVTDGQVLVWHDMLGLYGQNKLRFVKQFMHGQGLALNAVNAYADEVHHVTFPEKEHAYL